MATFLYYFKFVPILIAGVLLGRWFDQERKELKAKGNPWYTAWSTAPGIMIIIILCMLIAFRMYIRFSY